MNLRAELRPTRAFRHALYVGSATAVAMISLISLLACDCTNIAKMWSGATGVYAVLVGLLLARRASAPTALDLVLIRWGFHGLFLLHCLLYPAVWHLRGLL